MNDTRHNLGMDKVKHKKITGFSLREEQLTGEFKLLSKEEKAKVLAEAF